MASAKIVMLGMGGVGKSAFTLQFFSSTFVETYDPTLEDSYRKTIEVDDIPIVLNIYDTAGQEEYSAMRDEYMRAGEGLLLVYGITARNSFKEIGTFHEQILRVKDQDYVPVILAANKCDLEYERQVGMHEGRDFAKQLGCGFMETSAKDRINVDEAFSSLVREIRKYNKYGKEQTGRPAMPLADKGLSGLYNSAQDDGHGGCCSSCVVVWVHAVFSYTSHRYQLPVEINPRGVRNRVFALRYDWGPNAQILVLTHKLCHILFQRSIAMIH